MLKLVLLWASTWIRDLQISFPPETFLWFQGGCCSSFSCVGQLQLESWFWKDLMGDLSHISPLKPLGRALCLQRPMHSTRRAGLLTLLLTFPSATHSQGTCCEWVGNSQARICLCNQRISVHLWKYRLFPKYGRMPLEKAGNFPGKELGWAHRNSVPISKPREVYVMVVSLSTEKESLLGYITAVT